MNSVGTTKQKKINLLRLLIKKEGVFWRERFAKAWSEMSIGARFTIFIVLFGPLLILWHYATVFIHVCYETYLYTFKNSKYKTNLVVMYNMGV